MLRHSCWLPGKTPLAYLCQPQPGVLIVVAWHNSCSRTTGAGRRSRNKHRPATSSCRPHRTGPNRGPASTGRAWCRSVRVAVLPVLELSRWVKWGQYAYDVRSGVSAPYTSSAFCIHAPATGSLYASRLPQEVQVARAAEPIRIPHCLHTCAHPISGQTRRPTGWAYGVQRQILLLGGRFCGRGIFGWCILATFQPISLVAVAVAAPNSVATVVGELFLGCFGRFGSILLLFGRLLRLLRHAIKK